MPLVFRVDHEARVIVAAGYGTLTDGEVLGYHRQISALSETIGYDELIDMTDVTNVSMPSSDWVRELVVVTAGKDAARGPSKLAIVAPGDLAYALGRMFQTEWELDERSKKVVGVFRTMAEASAFLGIDRELALPTSPPPPTRRSPA
jgi:hypothetical protein